MSINRSPTVPSPAPWCPPSVSHAVAIIEALLAAEQGVKNITVGYGQCGNLIQDVAAIPDAGGATEEYLKKYGYDDVVVTTVLHQWMGGFPADEAKAFLGVIWSSTIAAPGHQSHCQNASRSHWHPHQGRPTPPVCAAPSRWSTCSPTQAIQNA